jgi:hypothetical protein
LLGYITHYDKQGRRFVIRSQAGTYTALFEGILTPKGHTCLVYAGVEVEFTEDSSKRIDGRTHAMNIIFSVPQFPVSQIESFVERWNGSYGNSRLDCGCPLFLSRPHIKTASEYIDTEMHTGARIVSDVLVSIQPRTGRYTLAGRLIEILKPETESAPVPEAEAQ